MSKLETAEPDIVIVPGSSLPNQKWWTALHSTIITSYQNKDFLAFPPTWTRLPSDPDEGAEGLTDELGPNGVMAVMLLDDQPIACAGGLPFRGPGWVNFVKSADERGDSGEASDDNTATVSSLIADMNDKSLSTLPEERYLSGWDPKTDWELCCFCVDPRHRRKGLSTRILDALIDHLKTLGATRLISNYVIEEAGLYWQHMGFETMPGAEGVLKKGFKQKPELEGLRADIHFAMGSKDL